MEQRISLVTLGVADLERAIRFYEDVLGWQRHPGPDGIAFFDMGGLVLALYPHDKLAEDFGAPPQAETSSAGFALAHNARSEDEVDGIFSRLGAAGATIVKAPERVFWGGYSGYFADPDGHKWEVAFNPHWTIAPDGRISMSPG